MKHWIVAAGIAGAVSAFTGSATASEWGCEVLLCTSSSTVMARLACLPPANEQADLCYETTGLLVADLPTGGNWPAGLRTI